MKMPAFNPFIRRAELQDEKIIRALLQAAEDYANGEIVEVHDLLIDITNAIEEFERQSN